MSLFSHLTRSHATQSRCSLLRDYDLSAARRIGELRRHEHSKFFLFGLFGLLQDLLYRLGRILRVTEVRPTMYLVVCTGRISQVVEPLEWLRRATLDRRSVFVLVGRDYGNEALINLILDEEPRIIKWSHLSMSRKARLFSPFSTRETCLVRHSQPFASCLPAASRPESTSRTSLEPVMDELRNKLQISSTIKLALVAFSEKEYYSTGFGRKAGDRFSVQEDFDAAVKILVASGHATLRIGAAVGPLAEALVDLGMIDYARSARNEKNDVALARACKLMIADASGAWWMTVPFSKQVLITNQYRIRNSLLGPEVTCLPALYWSRNSRRLLTLAEMFKLPKHPTWRDPSLEFVRCDRDAISQAVSNLLTPQESNSEAVERSEAIRRKISEMSGLNKLEFVCSIDPSFSLRHWDDLKI